jgi:hypothetical protein
MAGLPMPRFLSLVMRLHLFLFIIVLLSCASQESELQPATKADLRILYIGNSLTYANDLPALVKELGKRDGLTIEHTEFLFPNYSLEDHWNEGKVQKEIQMGSYDFVVAQQGPSALPESQVLLLDYATKLAGECKKAKSPLALYMVWPSADRSFDLDNVILSYTNAAKATQSLICPAGLAWKNAWNVDPALPLYSSDDFHPSLTGSALAAITIYAALMDKSNLDFIQHRDMSWKGEVSESRLAIMKQATLKALGK